MSESDSEQKIDKPSQQPQEELKMPEELDVDSMTPEQKAAYTKEFMKRIQADEIDWSKISEFEDYKQREPIDTMPAANKVPKLKETKPFDFHRYGLLPGEKKATDQE